jgi:hypothetical protein
LIKDKFCQYLIAQTRPIGLEKNSFDLLKEFEEVVLLEV